MKSYPFLQSIIDAIIGKKPRPKLKKPKPAKEVPFQRLVQVEHLPDFMQGRKNLRGVYIGGCISDPNAKWDNRHSAHAHTKGYDIGFICCKGERQFLKRTTMQHEVSHVATLKGHTRTWAKYYSSLDVPAWLTYGWLKRKYKFKVKVKKVINVAANKP